MYYPSVSVDTSRTLALKPILNLWTQAAERSGRKNQYMQSAFIKKWIRKLICSWCLPLNRMHTDGAQYLVSAGPSLPSCLTCLSSPPKPDLNHSSLQGSLYQIILQSSKFSSQRPVSPPPPNTHTHTLFIFILFS